MFREFLWTIRIHHVRNVDVDDRARIGWYTLKSLEYFSDLGELVIEGIETMSIRVEVSALHVVLECDTPPTIPMVTREPLLGKVWRRLTEWSR